MVSEPIQDPLGHLLPCHTGIGPPVSDSPCPKF